VPEQTKNEIKHFFERYKDLEPGKWVKIQGWQDKAAAETVIAAAYANYKH
jgi:inorganic pyrophosphatase